MTSASPVTSIDPLTFRKVMGRFPTGVAVVTFSRDDEPAGITVEGEHAGYLPLDRVELTGTVHYRVYALFVVAQLDADLVAVAVHAEREPHDPVELRLARADTGRAHPLTEAEQRRFGQRELTHWGNREATSRHVAHDGVSG
jgi:hypothetical protein